MYGDDIVMCGSTNSATGIATIDGFQTDIGGGNDAFVVKFDSDGSRKWGSYYGGTGTEFGGDVADAMGGSIVLVGRSKSTNAISTAMSHQPNLAGDYDAILVKFTGMTEVGSPVVTGNECRAQWISDTLVVANDSTQVRLSATFGTINALPSSSGTLALTSYAGYSIGMVVMYSGASVPSGFLSCDGSNVSRVTYAKLFDIIGTMYGVGDGSTTFGLPEISHSLVHYAIRYE
jgi:hypothetical protein